MDNRIGKSARAILVGVILLRFVFVLRVVVASPFDNIAIEIAVGEVEGTEKLAAEEADEYFVTDPFHWGLSSYSYLLSHYAHLKQGAEAHILEIVTPPPQGYSA